MKTIGILGGMGPDATCDFFAKVLAADPAARDQDHVHIVVECDPSIPDRTAAILGAGEDPLPAMLAAARRLEAAGAEIAGISCMTAHHFLPRLKERSSLRFVSAFEALARALRSDFPQAARIGALATVGSRKARLFESNLPGYEIVWPSEESHASLVMEAIYGARGIKAGNRGDYPRSLLAAAAGELRARGAEVIVAGCTEVPLALSPRDIDLPLVDPMAILAAALVREARGQ